MCILLNQSKTALPTSEPSSSHKTPLQGHLTCWAVFNCEEGRGAVHLQMESYMTTIL